MLILEIWKKQPGQFFCISTKSATGVWRDRFFARDELDTVPEFIRNNRDKDLYFCPHGFEKKNRHKEHAALPKLLWADLDEANPNDRKRFKGLEPTIAIESSPGRYVGLWRLDKTMNEDLNKRLTYHLEADIGGWDLSQVLRLPGTINYKYPSHPKVRILWDDGPVHKIKVLEKILPEIEDDPNEEEGEAVKLFDRYENKMKPWTRKTLMSRPTPSDDRSKVLYRLEHNLLSETGMTRREARILLWACAWNKYRGRKDGKKQLERELDKAVRSQFVKQNDEEGTPSIFLTRNMSEIEEEEVNWIWYRWIARGEVTLINGDPGVGKSYMMQMVAKAICDGEVLPSVKVFKRVQGKVAYFDPENSPATVTKKRLRFNNIKHPENFFQDEQVFSVFEADKMEHVYEAIERLKPDLVVFDTLNMYIGAIDTGRSNDSAQAMNHFKQIASRYNCGVVVLRHLTKDKRGDSPAIYRGQGNIAFTGTARLEGTVYKHPEDEELRVLVPIKNNLSAWSKALTFRIEELPDTLRDTDRSRFTWGEFGDYRAEELGKPVNGKEVAQAIDDAIAFLKDELTEDEIEVGELERKAESKSISKSTLYRAALKIGVKKETQGFGSNKKSYWYL